MLDDSGGTLSYAGRGNAAEARFAAGECAVLSASSDAAPLPESELEAVWRGEKSAPQALESYSRRINP